jgi:putative membrane protein insertion efficiency factor
MRENLTPNPFFRARSGKGDQREKIPRLVAVGLVAIYRAAVSPVIHAINGPACRFEPSCSVYARDAIGEYGIVRGGIKALWRVARCNPMGGHGFDPVRRGSLAPRGERVRVRDDCAARLSVAPHILESSENLVPHPPLEDERRPLPSWGEAK